MADQQDQARIMDEQEKKGLVEALRRLGIGAELWRLGDRPVIVRGTEGVKYVLRTHEHVQQYIDEVTEKLRPYTQCDPPASVSERSDAAQGWTDEPLWLGGGRDRAMTKVTVEIPDDLLKQWEDAVPSHLRTWRNQTLEESLGLRLRTRLRSEIVEWKQRREDMVRSISMKALAAGVQDTVTDNGDGTYTHALGRKDQPAKSSDR